MDDVLTMYKKQLKTDSEYLELFRKNVLTKYNSDLQKMIIHDYERRIADGKRIIANLENSN
jgi:hypothetical protein